MNGKAAMFTAIGLILGLLAGLAIGGFDGGERASSTPAPSEPLTDDPGARDETPLRSPALEPASVEPASLNQIIQRTETLPLPKGDGVISGVVRSKTGEAIEGAVITATPTYPEDRNRADLTLEQRIQEQIGYEKWRELARKKATSGADGMFRIEALAQDMDYAVWAELEGWSFERTPHRSFFKSGMEVTFTGTAVVRVPVEVRLPDGGLPRSSRAEFHKKGNPNSKFATQCRNGRSEIKLEPGEWIGRATAGDNREYTSPEVEFRIESTGPSEGVVLQLIGRPGVKGVISIPRGYTYNYLNVCLLPGTGAEPGVVLTPEDRESQVQEDYVGSIEEWRFQMLDIPSGTYRLVLLSDNRVLDWKSITIADDIVECNLEIPPAQAQDYIPVRVFDPKGEATTNVQVLLAVDAEQASYSHWADVFIPDPAEDLLWIRRTVPAEYGWPEDTEWTYRVTVVSEKYGTLVQNHASTIDQTLEFRFVSPAHVVLTVPGFDEHELSAKMRWSVVGVGQGGKRADDFGYDPRENREPGEPFRFGPFTPGEYDLVLMIEMRVRSRELLRRTLVLTGGDNFVQGDVPRLGTLTVRCRTEAEANAMGFYREGDRYAIWDDEVKRDGALVTYYSLPPGEYNLETSAGEMSVEVSGDTVIDFLPRVYDCLLIRSIRPRGEVEALGLRNGDKLIEVDGNPCKDIKTFRAHVDVSLSKDGTTWTVLRDGVRTDITFNGQALTEILKNKRENKEDIDLNRGYRD